jgi:hypothetical protein
LVLCLLLPEWSKLVIESPFHHRRILFPCTLMYYDTYRGNYHTWVETDRKWTWYNYVKSEISTIQSVFPISNPPMCFELLIEKGNCWGYFVTKLSDLLKLFYIFYVVIWKKDNCWCWFSYRTVMTRRTLKVSNSTNGVYNLGSKACHPGWP